MEVIALDRSTGLNKEARLIHHEGKRILYNSIGTSILAQRLVLRDLFLQLKQRWQQETINLSSPRDVTSNLNYIRIIRLGKPVLPFILDDLQESPNYWFHALSEISQEDPVLDEHFGDLQAMTTDWIEWGKGRHLI